MAWELNGRAVAMCRGLVPRAAELNLALHRIGGALVIDCGCETSGGLEAGRLLAEICLAGLGRVEFAPPEMPELSAASICVQTDQPLAACLGAQYAGWQIAAGKFFAMGSGPMRAAAAVEPLIEELGLRESPDQAIGVLESRRLPPPEAVRSIADKCRVSPDRLTLLTARTASLAGHVQVVARSVETALHKLHTLGFDLRQIVAGFGTAPLPPIAKDDLAGIGRTNDAVLYGSRVTLWCQSDDALLAEFGRQTPSSASHDYGAPFAEIFERAGRDFYKIDGRLFSPAVVTFVNLRSGRQFSFGQLAPEILARSCSAA